MKLKVNKNYSPSMKKGDIVEVDKIRQSDAAGGFSLRVVGVWKKPQWFSILWFVPKSNQ